MKRHQEEGLRNEIFSQKNRRIMIQQASFYYVTITVWLIMDSTVEAYRSGCSGGYCFIISDYNDSNERLDQSAAQRWCQSNGTQLAEIRNRDIQNSTINFIKAVYSQGLNGWNVTTNGKRSSNNWNRLNGNGIGGLTVYNQSDASYAYGYLKSTTSGFDLFASKPVDNKSGFICTGLSNCSGGVTISGQCYKSFTETLSWYDARNRCLNKGGDMASFDHITTNGGFNALNVSWISTSNSYWIGIRREWWIWQTTNSDVKYSDWITGHPINDVGRANSDCLCLSTTEWKWIECGCNQQLPFACISDNNSTTSSTTTGSAKATTTSTTTSTTTRSPTSTTRSTTITSTTKTTSKATSLVASESSGVSTPGIATVTSDSTPAANDTENLDQPVGLSREATIGIAVGVAVGGALLITALIVAVIILRRKRCPLRCPRKKTNAKVRPPPILTQDSKNNDHSSDGMENPYALVVSSSPKYNNANTNIDEDSSETSIIYAQLDFDKEPQNNRDGSVIIVPGKTKPSTLPKPPATKDVAKKVNVDDDMMAEATTA